MERLICFLKDDAWITSATGNYCAVIPSGNQAADGSLSHWIIGGVVFIFLCFLIGGLFSDEPRREESADIMMTKRGYWTQIEDELWRLKAGGKDDGTLANLEAELAAFEQTLEIAPGEGAYWRRKR